MLSALCIPFLAIKITSKVFCTVKTELLAYEIKSLTIKAK